MALPRKTPLPADRYIESPEQDRIIIERRELIGEVQSSKDGHIPMVVAAFNLAGEYLNGQASAGMDPARVEFTYKGVRFTAAFGDEEG
jgi:hypothetical protein